MRQFLVFTRRNLRIYFRDKGAVFFSFLSMLIIIGLMVFFIADAHVDSITQLLGAFEGRDPDMDKKNAELLILSWTCAGIISINAATVTLAVYTVMIKDRVQGKLSSIYTAPVSRTVITLGYVAAAWVASLIMCTLTLFITELYGVTKGLDALSLPVHLKLFGMIMVNSFVYAAIMYVMAALAKTEGAWSGLGTIVGTLIGFLGGIYIPLGTLSQTIARITKCTPAIYGTAMFRSVMSKDILEKTFDGVPDDVVESYRKMMGIDLELFDKAVSEGMQWTVLIAFGAVFMVLGVLLLKYGKKTDR
ncbi:MAG: ABC transporter permease [Lachnospiraceae bacterium]|nr:ABC transporter permease [Lachnospiraceae bacterium]